MGLIHVVSIFFFQVRYMVYEKLNFQLQEYVNYNGTMSMLAIHFGYLDAKPTSIVKQ